MARKPTQHTAYWQALRSAAGECHYLSGEVRHRGGITRLGRLSSMYDNAQLGIEIALLSAAILYDVGTAVRDAFVKIPDGKKREKELEWLRHEARRLRRPLYYQQENERRRALAAERRRIRRRRTTAPMPTAEQVFAAWNARKASKENAIRLGGMLQDLECYVDNALLFGDDGTIRGRRGGIRSWVRTCLPELLPHYKTLMRYKAMAVRLRQATGTKDPQPTEELLEAKRRHEVVKAVLEDPRPTFASIMEVLDRYLSPERIDEVVPLPSADKPRGRRQPGDGN